MKKLTSETNDIIMKYTAAFLRGQNFLWLHNILCNGGYL